MSVIGRCRNAMNKQKDKKNSKYAGQDPVDEVLWKKPFPNTISACHDRLLLALLQIKKSNCSLLLRGVSVAPRSFCC